MKPVEQVKIITGETVESVEHGLNVWFSAVTEERKKNVAIANIPLKVLSREFSFINVKPPLFAVAIFYEDFALARHEKGGPNTKAPKKGVSAIGKVENIKE